MIRLNDHYFISWLKVVKKYDVTTDNDIILVNMTNEEYSDALKEYNNSYRSTFKEIRAFVKKLARHTSKRSNT